MKGLRTWASLALCGLVGCVTPDATQVTVAVRTDFAVPPMASAELDAVDIVVSRDADSKTATVTVALTDGTQWPLTLAVTPNGSSTALVNVVGRKGDEKVIEQSALVRFSPEEKRLLVIDLRRNCADIVCANGTTCSEGGCAPMDRTDEDLASWDGNVPELPEPKRCTGKWTVTGELALPKGNAYDHDASFTADLLELYFVSNRANDGKEDIFVAKRPSADAAWGNPEVVNATHSAVSPEYAQISRDGLRLWFSRVVGDYDTNLFVSSRATRDDEFGAPTEIPMWPATDAPSFEADPSEFDDGQLLVFATTHKTGGTFDMFVSQRLGDDATEWSPPVELGISQHLYIDFSPLVTNDGARLYYSKAIEKGGRYFPLVASRNEAATDFEKEKVISELVIDDEKVSTYGMAVSENECFATFTREAPAVPVGVTRRIFTATRDE